jgi:SAM-dependent methyltransferase
VYERQRYTETNSHSWDRWAAEGCAWTVPISHSVFLDACHGQVGVLLTPTKSVPSHWLSDLRNKEILGLASAGGQQCPIFAAQGARVTVFDISESQLDSEAAVARREGYSISLVHGDMAEALPFEDERFDLVFHPVSNSYVRDVRHVWQECYRVLRPGGFLLSGFTNPMVYMFEERDEALVITHRIPFDPLSDCDDDELLALATTDGVQFSHTLEEQLGGQLQAGFSIVDIYEDRHPSSAAETCYSPRIGQVAMRLSEYTPVYVATRAAK